MARKYTVGTAILGAALFCLSTLTQAEGTWWRATETADLNLPGAIEACAKLANETKGFDRIGCAITAILVGRTALARDQFLLVTDADARDCIQETSATATTAPPVLVLVAAYCKSKVASFADSRRLLEPLKASAGNSGATDTLPQFEAFRTAVLAHAMNGEGEWEKAINLIRQHRQFPNSDILQAELFAIYVENERRDDLLAWWNGLKSSTFSDPPLRALFEAQIALIRGSPEDANHALDAALSDSQQDGSKALTVAKYRIDRLRGVPEKDAEGNDQARMETSVKMTMGPNSRSYQDQARTSFRFGPIQARGVNFTIDKDKLNRPGVALPIGFFY